MQSSRSRKLERIGVVDRTARASRTRVLLRRAPIAAAVVAAIPRLYAAEAGGTGGLEEVVVTAEKRTENLQDVPISITALGTARLQELGVQNFNDYVKFLPSIAYQTSGPGFAKIYMRGVASGDNANHSGPLPSVGVYLDEQPVTTIQGPLDIHVYDIERVEALAGPQGTLYGASSEAGTVRIITNKPDASAFKAGYDVTGNTLRGQGGYVAEGFVNIPVGSSAAVRLVGWAERDGGYIDNVPGTISYPSDGCLSNFSPPAAGCQTTPVRAKHPAGRHRLRGSGHPGGSVHTALLSRLHLRPVVASGAHGRGPCQQFRHHLRRRLPAPQRPHRVRLQRLFAAL